MLAPRRRRLFLIDDAAAKRLRLRVSFLRDDNDFQSFTVCAYAMPRHANAAVCAMGRLCR